MNKVETAINKLEHHINVLASSVLSKDQRESFIKLDLKQKIIGIGVFATLGKDNKMVEFSNAALKYYDQLKNID